jgi:hypothetical protein
LALLLAGLELAGKHCEAVINSLKRSSMLNSMLAVVRNGRIELTEETALPEGTKLLVTFLTSEEEQQFWLQASQDSLRSIWDNPQDDEYAKFLET